MTRRRSNPSEGLIRKLHPRRFTDMSGKMAAIVGAILSVTYTTPSLVELIVDGDGNVLGRRSDDIGFNEWLGSVEDLQRNWDALLSAADDLTPQEWAEAQRLYQRAVGRRRRS